MTKQIKKPKQFKELKDLTKEERDILEKWRMANGCITFDYENDDILIHDGGLFGMEDKPKRVQNTKVSFAKKPSYHTLGGKKHMFHEIIFTKMPGTYIQHNYVAYQWPSELDDTIEWMKRLKRVLNKVGIETNRSLNWQKGIYKVWKNGKWVWEKRNKK